MRKWMILTTLSTILLLSACATTRVDADIPPDPILKEVPPKGDIVTEREQVLEYNLREMLKWGKKVKVMNE